MDVDFAAKSIAIVVEQSIGVIQTIVVAIAQVRACAERTGVVQFGHKQISTLWMIAIEEGVHVECASWRE